MLEALIDSQDLDLSRNLDLISEQFEDAHPQDILNWAVDSYTDKLALVTSFQPTGIVTLHMLQVIGAYISVITLDTGLLFPETQQLIEQVEARFDISVTRVKPTQTLDQQAVAHGDALW